MNNNYREVDDSRYLGNPKLKGKDTKIEFTKEQVEEFIKCQNDPIYFIENYVKIVHVDHGLVPFKLRDYQKALVLAYHNNNRVISLQSRQLGKCQNIDALLTVRNKKNGEIKAITIGELFENSTDLQNELRQ